MFDIGFWEILLILILALVVIGPERLPGAARTLGLWIGKTRRFVEGVKSDVEEEFDVTEFKRIIHNQEIQLNELKEKMSAPVKSLVEDVDEVAKQTHSIEEENSDRQEDDAEEASVTKATKAGESNSKGSLAE